MSVTVGRYGPSLSAVWYRAVQLEGGGAFFPDDGLGWSCGDDFVLGLSPPRAGAAICPIDSVRGE